MSSFSPVSWWRGRKEKKEEEKYRQRIQYMAQNDTEWEPFWKNYGKVLKYGVLEDAGNKERLSKVCKKRKLFINR